MVISLQRSAFIDAIQKHEPASIAIMENDSGAIISYSSLLRCVARAKELLLLKTGKSDNSISGERIAFIIENGLDYVGMYAISPTKDVCQSRQD